MVGQRKNGAGKLLVALVCALIAAAPGCRRKDAGSQAVKCKPPTDEKLGQFVRLQSEGIELYQKLKTDEAIQKLEAALALNPCDVSVHNDLGIAYHQKHETKKAVELLKAAIALDPLYPLSHLNLGIVYDEISNLPDAAKEITEFLQLNPDLADGHSRLGSVYYKMNKYDEARASLEKAAKLKPDDAEIWYNLGNIASHDKQFDKAEEYFRKTLEKNPNLTEAHYKLASALQRLGREDEAKGHFDKFKQLNVHQSRIDELQRILVSSPERAQEAHLALGIELIRVGRHEEAIDNLERSASMKELPIDGLVAMAEAHRRLKHFDQALAIASKVKEMDAGDARAYDTIMAAYSDQGKDDLAIAEVKRLMEKKPEYKEALLNLGILEQSRGNYKAAIQAFEKYLADNPENLLAHDALLAIYTSGEKTFRDKKKALAEAKVAERLGSTLYQHLAEAYHMNNDSARAKQILERGLADAKGEAAAILKAHLEKIGKEGHDH